MVAGVPSPYTFTMRFAYIDSQGNEVPIPSIDALALRIELGAVGPDTELYDAQADHWGPAHTHEIFHSLSRDAEEEGFMAPPPPAAVAPPTSDSAPEAEAPDAYDIVLLAPEKDPWPLKKDDIEERIAELQASPAWAHKPAGCIDIFFKKKYPDELY